MEAVVENCNFHYVFAVCCLGFVNCHTLSYKGVGDGGTDRCLYTAGFAGYGIENGNGTAPILVGSRIKAHKGADAVHPKPPKQLGTGFAYSLEILNVA